MEEEEDKNEITWDDLDAFKKRKRRRKQEDISKEEIILKDCREKQLFIAAERERISYFRRHHKAAVVIQKAWKMFKFRTKGILKNAREAVRKKRLDAGELEWKQQIAACTIQLAWRKYARRRLLERIQSKGSLAIHMWDPDMIAMKQRHVMEQIYGEHMYAPEWHPTIHAPNRPSWITCRPSPAALSYNFALDQYKQPLTVYTQDYASYMYGRNTNQSTHYNYIEELDKQIQDGLAEITFVHNMKSPTQFSYNMT